MNTTGPTPWRSALIGLVALAALSIAAVEPPGKQNADVAASTFNGQGSGLPGAEVALEDVGDAAAGTVTDAAVDAGTAGTEGTAGAAGTQAAGKAGANGGGGGGGGGPIACKAGQNGGNTDKGVSADRIKLAATNVRSGSGSSFLGSSYIGMQAAVNRVNANGGICGRIVELRLVDDGWEAARGATFIKNFTQEDYFALPVVPSSEGLTQAIVNQTIGQAGIPVVGTDGMLKEQYNDPWVWPVATSTVSTMRVMTKHAIGRGAKSFGVIYDQQYKFGKEGAAAFRQYVREATGADPKAFVGITPGKPNYAGDAQRFNADCGEGGCDFVAMLLDPTTANTYIQSQVDKDGKRQGFGRLLTGGAQPLFNERFARDCRQACDGMLVWTGYNPPTGRLASLPDVATYVSDVKSVVPSVDVTNQFLEGSYLGMRVFLQALEAVGGDLNRARLRDVMNSMTYSSDLSSPLSWKATRFANSQAQPFRIQTTSGNFAGFAEEGSGFIADPTPGVVPKD